MRVMASRRWFRPRHEQSRAGHKIYPYLLRGLAIAEPNHVWAADITYIPMARGFLYLVAIMDWASRLFWLAAVEHDRRRLLRRGSGGGSVRMDAEDFQHRPGRAIHQRRFTGKLEARESRFRWDGAALHGQHFHRTAVRSIKYEEIHLKAYADGRERAPASVLG